MTSGRDRKALTTYGELITYGEIIEGCDKAVNLLEEVELLLREKDAIAVIQGPRGSPPELIGQLLEIQRKAHKISSFGNKISEVACTTRLRLEG